MAIEWTPNLTVGVESIDHQHKTLFDKANQLFEAGKALKQWNLFQRCWIFWMNTQNSFFTAKEVYMRSLQLSGYDDQSGCMHFIQALTKLKRIIRIWRPIFL